MKILLVSNVFKDDTVGPARFAKLLLDSKVFDVNILTYEGDNRNGVINVPLNLPFWKRKMTQFYSIPILQKKIREIAENYDFILFNNAMLAYNWKLEIPSAVMVNDEKSISPTYSFSFDYLRRMMLRKLEKNSVENSKCILVNSAYLKNKLLQNYNQKGDRVHVLNKGISLSNKMNDFEHSKLSTEVPIKVLFVKNDYGIGGLFELVEALHKMYTYKFQLTLIGPDKSIIYKLKDLPNIEYKVSGKLKNERVIDAMYGNDILCIPSRFETLGVAVMEGLAVGIPVITTGVGGLPEVTNNGNHVWECEPNNPRSIIQQIRECIENKDERISKSERGKAYVFQNFNFNNVEQRLADIIDAQSRT